VHTASLGKLGALESLHQMVPSVYDIYVKYYELLMELSARYCLQLHA